VLGPALTGFVLQHTGSFFAPFAITASICVIGVIAWILIVGRVEPVSWVRERPSSVATASAQA